MKCDYYPYSSKLSDIIKSNKKYSSDLGLHWFYQLIEGVKCLHSNGIYPSLTSNDIIVNEENEVRIKETISNKLICETLNVIDNNRSSYISPELLNNNKNNFLKENKLSSYFSLGIIGFEIFNHYKPFNNIYEMCLYENRPEMLPSLNERIDKTTQKLIYSLLNIRNRNNRTEIIESEELKKPIINIVGSSLKATTKNEKFDEIINEYNNKEKIEINPIEVVGDKKKSNRNNFTSNQYHLFMNLLSNQIKYVKPKEIEILSKLNSFQLQELYMKIMNEKNNELKKFTLNNNILNFYSCNILLLMLQRMLNIEELNLENNVINEDGLIYIIKKLKDLKNLKVLNLNGSILNEESIEELRKLKLDKLEKCVISIKKDETNTNLLNEVKEKLNKIKGVEVNMIEEDPKHVIGKKKN